MPAFRSRRRIRDASLRSLVRACGSRDIQAPVLRGGELDNDAERINDPRDVTKDRQKYANPELHL